MRSIKKRSVVSILKSILINGLILVSVYFAVHTYQTRNVVVGAAPELSGVLLNGLHFSGLAEMEKPAIIHFWATWCKICEFEQEAINRLSREHSVVSIASSSGSYQDVKQFVSNNSIEFLVINDASNRIALDWGVAAFPTSFIIDEDSNIRFVEVGLTTEVGLRFRLWLTKFL